MGKENELPAWKIKAIERGVIPDPRITAPQDAEPEKGKKRSDRHGNGYVAIWVRPEVVTRIHRLALYLGLPPSSGVGKVVERLVVERMEEFREIDELIDRKIQGK